MPRYLVGIDARRPGSAGKFHKNFNYSVEAASTKDAIDKGREMAQKKERLGGRRLLSR